MNLVKTALVAALASLAFSAQAMTTIADDDLSAISGQDGVSIVADLNINIGSFKYIDSGATVGFNNIDVKGLVAMTIDVLSSADFQTAAATAISTVAAANNQTVDVATLIGATAAATGYVGGSDVVQFAFPTINADARKVSPTITVGSITTGNGGASFGGMQIQNMDLQGTKVWMYGH